ncbi:MAG: hypothetical protein HZC55_00995 [Verrucomicrobia bacterium]|nr:hypothetical protein [Verrucomicrobiota bacterium]
MIRFSGRRRTVRRRWMATVRSLPSGAALGALALAVGLVAGCRRDSPAAAPKEVPTQQSVAAVAPKASIVVPAAVAAARAERDPRLRSRRLGQALEEWFRSEPEAVLAYVRALPRGSEQTEAWLLVLGWLGRSDPDRALAVAAEVETRGLSPFYAALFAQLAAQDSAGAVARLSRVPAGPERAQAIRATMDAWARRDPSAALAWARALSNDSESGVAVETGLVALAAADPDRAVAQAREWLGGPAFERVVGQAFQVLLTADASRAAALVASLPAGETRTLATVQAARALAIQDPARAVAWISALPAGDDTKAALPALIEAWGRRDPAAAAAQLATLPDHPGRAAAGDRLAQVWGATEPAAAIAWAGRLPDATARDSALVAIASAWAQREPRAAATWAAGLEADAEVRNRALAGAVDYWLLQDRAGVQEFVAGLPAATQTVAAAAIAPGLAQRDPPAALTWAQSLSSTAGREAAVVAAYARWRDNAPAAAAAWLAQSGLPAELKERLRAAPAR